MASGIYRIFKANLMNGECDLEADTIMVALLDDSHAFDATDVTWTALNANELDNGDGYTTGGETLAGGAVTAAAATKWDGTDVAWTASTFTAYHAVLYDSTVGVTNNLICSIDFGGAKTVTAGTFTIQWDSDGIITLSGGE